jgi:hypothetical protein
VVVKPSLRGLMAKKDSISLSGVFFLVGVYLVFVGLEVSS